MALGGKRKQKVVLGGDGYQLVWERDIVELRSRGHYEIATGWKFVDPAGHEHTTTETLETVVTGTYWCNECRDEHDESEWRCRQCAAVVKPEWRWVDTSHKVQILPGLIHMRLELDDGRGWILRPEEFPELAPGDDVGPGLATEVKETFPGLAAWAAAFVASREPDYMGTIYG